MGGNYLGVWPWPLCSWHRRDDCIINVEGSNSDMDKQKLKAVKSLSRKLKVRTMRVFRDRRLKAQQKKEGTDEE